MRLQAGVSMDNGRHCVHVYLRFKSVLTNEDACLQNQVDTELPNKKSNWWYSQISDSVQRCILRLDCCINVEQQAYLWPIIMSL